MRLRNWRGVFVVASAVLAFSVLLVLGSTTTFEPAPAYAQDTSPLGHIKSGLREYRKGNWEEAIKFFDRALSANRDEDTDRQIRDEIGQTLALDFINNNFSDATLSGRYSRFGKWILAGRQKSAYIGRDNGNPEEMRENIDKYYGEKDITVKSLRAQSIRDSYGDYAVPHIQANYLHQEAIDARYDSRVLLATLGHQAVNAIIQLFYSSEVYDRQVAAEALGDIGDPRALPVLVKHFSMQGEDQQVRQACAKAIEWIRRDLPEQDKKINDPKDLFFLQAEGYYRNNAAGRYYGKRLSVVGTTYQGHLPVAMWDYNNEYGYMRSYTVWKWVAGEDGTGGALLSQEVPLWAYADILAEESALQAFELGISAAKGSEDTNAFVRDSEALLACIHMHMYTEGRGRFFKSDSAERAFIESLLGERGFVPNIHGYGLGSATNSAVLYTALERSLTDGYPAVSVAICDAIADLEDYAAIGTNASAPLMRALTAAEDKMVRYAAARTLVKLGATKDFGKNSEVEKLVAANLKETQARSILVIAEDPAIGQGYVTAVRDIGHSVTLARTLEEGADLAVQGPPWDAIIIEGSLAVAPVFVFEPPAGSGGGTRTERKEVLFHLLARDVRTQATPVFVATPASEMASRKDELSELGVGDNLWLEYTPKSSSTEFTSTTLGEQLQSEWNSREMDAKNLTNASVVRMADALAMLDPGTTKYRVDVLLKALSGGLRLEGRTPEARAAICRAIEVLVANSSKVGAAWVRQEIIPNLLDTVSSEEEGVDRPFVKAAAARALGAAYAFHKGAWDEDGFKALMTALRTEFNLESAKEEGRDLDALVLEVEAARNAAGEALGRAPTKARQRLEVQKQQAVNRHAPPPNRRTAKAGDEG